MSVRDLLSRTDSRELTEWRAFYIARQELERERESKKLSDKLKAALLPFKE
ncbi:MAG: hypothetical protein IT388_11920 [Nitrospirales bacterium]|nr:hypothetical protein [Nitrospirales bacterium]